MSTAGQKFMTELSTRTINAAAPSSSGSAAPPAKWKSPRCSQACWDEIRVHDARCAVLLQRLLDVTSDRDEWKQQHENLLAIRQQELRAAAQAGPEPAAWLYQMAFYIKPSDDLPFRDWKQVVTIAPPPSIPKDGVRNVVPLYASPPAALLAGEDMRKQSYEIARHVIGYLEGNCGLSFTDVKQTDWDAVTRLVATLALPSTHHHTTDRNLAESRCENCPEPRCVVCPVSSTVRP